MSSSNILFSDDFTVTDVNAEGKKFEKVDRIIGRGLNLFGDLLIDVHNELFEVNKNDTIHIALMSTTSADGRTSMPQEELESRLRSYDYVMNGIVYKIKHLNNDNLEVHLSHGGLLARFSGKTTDLSHLDVDSQLYTLVRKKRRRFA